MAHLLLLGSWRGALDVVSRLQEEHVVTLLSQAGDPAVVRSAGIDLLLAGSAGLDTARSLGLPWIACGAGTDTASATAAYRAGALAVLPDDAPPDLVESTVARLLATLNPLREAPRAVSPPRWQRRYRSGERILLDPEHALETQEGVIALTVLHEDGTEVLLGLYGPGQVLAGHPEDHCCIQLCAHTDAVIRVLPWTEAVARPGFADRLRDRLRLMEAWAAMQARPQIEQRLFGILSILAEQFGRATQRGTLIEVKVTHAQLASAVGATRTTVTRLLGRLRRRGLLSSVASSSGERFCLREWDELRHSRSYP
ncbi:MAG TPA: Crp/Fnr family transcriptional regulator [Thermoanaerobaculia bacterium]|nr:Crp/Fnr family transcriptional regulator [Thermoanaerobaculia bacterium]